MAAIFCCCLNGLLVSNWCQNQSPSGWLSGKVYLYVILAAMVEHLIYKNGVGVILDLAL